MIEADSGTLSTSSIVPMLRADGDRRADPPDARDTMDAHEEAIAAAAGPGNTLLERLAERIGGRAKAEAVFGAPVQHGEVTVIPVARVRWGLGAGRWRLDLSSSPDGGYGWRPYLPLDRADA
jgi:hypothetical protein